MKLIHTSSILGVAKENDFLQHKDTVQVPVQRFPGQDDVAFRSKDLYVDTSEQLPSIADHGFRFMTLPEQVDGRSDKVLRALSTRTASIPEMR